MHFEVRGHGRLKIEGLTPSGLPALKLVAYHCPELQVACHNGVGTLRVCLKDIDLTQTLSSREPLNVDRAQLAKLGG